MTSRSARIDLALTNLGFNGYLATFRENDVTDGVMDLLLEDEYPKCVEKLFTLLVPSLGHQMSILIQFGKVTRNQQIQNEGGQDYHGQRSTGEEYDPDQDAGTSSNASAEAIKEEGHIEILEVYSLAPKTLPLDKIAPAQEPAIPAPAAPVVESSISAVVENQPPELS